MKHLFSESSVWKRIFEFVSPDGRISPAQGESVISVHETGIRNESWAEQEGLIIRLYPFLLLNIATNRRIRSLESKPEYSTSTGTACFPNSG